MPHPPLLIFPRSPGLNPAVCGIDPADITPAMLLEGKVPAPVTAEPLYKALVQAFENTSEVRIRASIIILFNILLFYSLRSFLSRCDHLMPSVCPSNSNSHVRCVRRTGGSACCCSHWSLVDADATGVRHPNPHPQLPHITALYKILRLPSDQKN